MGQQLSGKVRVAASQPFPHILFRNALLKAIAAIQNSVCPARSSAAVGDGKYSPGDVDFGIVIDPGPVGDLQCEAFFPSLSFCFAIAIALWPWKICPLAGITGSEIGVAGLRVRSRPLIDAALARNGIQANIVQRLDIRRRCSRW